ncbi:MAG: AAA family ATPase [Cyclobacteriaceae bacterium]
MDEGHELNEYGEGANKLFRILVQLALEKGGRLLIDEVDAGIHHSRFLDFWKTILQFASVNETQIFATTHNLECLKYFDEILKKPDYIHLQNESRMITLKALPDGQIKSYTRVFDEFDYELVNNIEFRGESNYD